MEPHEKILERADGVAIFIITCLSVALLAYEHLTMRARFNLIWRNVCMPAESSWISNFSVFSDKIIASK